MTGAVCPFCQASVPPGQSACISCGAPLLAPATPARYLATGHTLQQGKFAIGRVLGEGSFGITYKGAHTELRQPVAIKELFPNDLGAVRVASRVTVPAAQTNEFQRARDNALEEARVIAGFQARGIVDVYDMFLENGTAYIVMEYLEGQTLEARLDKTGGLPLDEVRRIAQELCAALEEVHARQLLHRDIKPGNVMLTPEGRAVLIDFGSARSFQADRTQQHTRILTFGYAAPEQFSSEARFGPYTDIFGLGATLYHALTGAPPPQAMERLQSGRAPTWPSGDPDPLHAALQQALELRAEDRPPTVAAFRDLLGEVGSPTSDMSLPVPTARTNNFTSPPQHSVSVAPPDDKLIEYLGQIFPGLDAPGRTLVASHMERKELAPYRNLYQQAEPSRAFYVIHTGRVSSAGADARPVFTSTAGNALGEQDFFRGEPRGFTARAESKTVYWEMTEARFLRVLHAQPAVGLQIEGERIAQLDLYLRDRLASVSVLDGLGPDILLALARLFAPRPLQAGEPLYRQGESAQGLFLTDQGRLAQADTGAPIPPGTLQGADALRTDRPYAHDVVAQEPALCWMLSRSDFQRLQAAHPTLPRALGRGAGPAAPPAAEARALSLLSRSALLSALPPDVLQALAAQAFGRRLQAGDAIYRMQDASDAFFLLVEGEIELSQASATGVNQELSRVAAGAVFGLESLLRTAPRTQQATATVDTELLVFPREALETLRRTHDAVAQWWAQAAPPAPAPEPLAPGPDAARVDLGDLSLFSVFTGLSGAEAARVLPELREARFFPQEQIYAKGDELAYLYCVQEGTVQLEREASAGPRTAGPGSLLGLVSLMAQQPCPEHAFASTEVRLVTLSRAAVQRLSRDVPRFGENLWRVATAAPAAPPVTPSPASPYSQPPPAPPGRAPAASYPPPPAPPAPTGGAPPSRQNEPFLPLDPGPAPPASGWQELAALSWAGKIRFLFTLLALLYLLAALAAFLLPQILSAEILETLSGFLPG